MTLHFFPCKCVSILRVFYDFGKPINKKIGIKDFTPKLKVGSGSFKKPSFEPLLKCITRASSWLSDNPNIDFKNAQCLEIKVKVKSLTFIETDIMSHSAW